MEKTICSTDLLEGTDTDIGSWYVSQPLAKELVLSSLLCKT